MEPGESAEEWERALDAAMRWMALVWWAVFVALFAALALQAAAVWAGLERDSMLHAWAGGAGAITTIMAMLAWTSLRDGAFDRECVRLALVQMQMTSGRGER